MDEPTTGILRRWLKKAENDLLDASNNLDARDVPADTVCFHAQQAIEKLFKGVLVANGRSVPRSHDLVRLLTEVADLLPELLPFEERLEEISEYGVAVRYPGEGDDPTIEEARQAYETARTIQSIVIDRIGRATTVHPGDA